jgi:hypothetical protein
MIYNKDFSADIPHFNILQYREGDHVMNIEIDMRDSIPCLYLSSINQWEKPHDEEILSEDKRTSIFANVQYYLRKVRGISIETAE